MTPAIHVDPRAAGRLDWLAKPAASAAAADAHAARVHVMKDGEQLGGPNAIGRPGDLILENDEVVFVLDQLGSSSGFAESGGNLVDAADAHVRKDELGQMFTYFGTFPRQGVYDRVTSGTAGDGSAWVEASGKELYEDHVTVMTRYTLHAPDRALLVETRVENTGDAPVVLPALGDAIQWGGAEKVAPGKPHGFKGPSSGPYIGGVGRFVSYAVTSTDGAVDAVNGSSWSDTMLRKSVPLAPHGHADYARVFVVGQRPDTAALVSELSLAAGQPVGTLHVRLSAPPPPGFAVHLTPAGGTEALTLAAPFEATLPVGAYSVGLPSAAGGGDVGSVQVRAGADAAIDVPLTPPAVVDVQCNDARGGPMPCKITFEAQGATPPPDFGPAYAAGPARNQATTADGHVSVSLAPGAYRVTASRGPEYALAQTDVTLAPQQHATLSLAPRLVVDTDGYVGCDFHQHTMLGTDAPTGLRDRVVSNVAEGVDVAVASEHNVIADLTPIIRAEGVSSSLVSIPGDELTSDASRKPWGHANAWPLVVDPSKPRGGAPPVRDRTAKETFEGLRRSGDFVLQINHPRSGINGYFDQLGFDRARGAGADPSYYADFDALEVWNGRNVGPRDAVLEDWRALLRAGHPVTPTADTDTHGVVGQEAGYPRTYVRVSDDTRLETWDAARTADLVHGVKVLRDVVLTNGPMLRVTANGAPIGGLAKAVRGKVSVNVHVECAPWVQVDTLAIVHAQEGARDPPRPVKLAPTKAGALAADVVIPLVVRSDDAIAIVASGSRPMTPVLTGDGKEISPWAMTGAVWIDADGDGKSLGR